MNRRLVVLGLTVLILSACGSNGGSVRTLPTLPTLAPGATAPPSTTTSGDPGGPAASVPTANTPAGPIRSPSSPVAQPAPSPGPASRTDPTPPPADPGTAKPVLSRAEASTGLCQSIVAANSAVLDGNYVGGALRLSGGISNYGDAADPAITTAARTMLSSGVNGDPDGYVAARSTAVAPCAAVGVTIPTGGIECVTTPCP